MDRADLVRKLANEIDAIDVEDRPSQMPRVPVMAAEWFLGLVSGSGANGSGVFHMLKLFMAADEALQNLVIDVAAEGIPWRGDSYDEFLVVIRETKEMKRIGVDAYRKQVLQNLGAIGVDYERMV